MATPYQPRAIAAPQLNPGDEPYFDAAAQNKLLLKKCTSCGALHHYPRPYCPYCLKDTGWIEASGGGAILTFSITRRGVLTPYAIAYVKLDEGVSMMTNIVDCDLDDIAIGRRVRVVFKPTTGDKVVPMFTLI